MSDIDIKSFCIPRSAKQLLSRPFSLNGRTYATNGHMAACIDGIHADPLDDSDVKIESVFEKIDPDRYVAFDRITDVPVAKVHWCAECGGAGRVIKCDVCDGSGEHECSDHLCQCKHNCGACDGEGKIAARSKSDPDAVACEGCNGTGRKPDARHIHLGCGVAMQWRYLQAVQALPGPIEWSVTPSVRDPIWGHDTYSPIGFRGPGWHAVVMPVRSTACMDIERPVLTEVTA